MTNRNQVAMVAQQIGSDLMPDNAMWMNRFTVKSSSSSTVYTVAQRKTDHIWGCSCRGWVHYRHCKHLTDILSRLAQFTTTMDLNELDNSVVEMLHSARTAFLDHGVIPPNQIPSLPRVSRQLDL